MVPVLPLSLIVVPLPVQTADASAVAVPPTDVALTVRVATAEVRLAPPQPTMITRYW